MLFAIIAKSPGKMSPAEDGYLQRFPSPQPASGSGQGVGSRGTECLVSILPAGSRSAWHCKDAKSVYESTKDLHLHYSSRAFFQCDGSVVGQGNREVLVLCTAIPWGPFLTLFSPSALLTCWVCVAKH